MASATEDWAVGINGTILCYAGGTWTRAPSPNGDALYGVALASPTEGWAVGSNVFGGTILHYTDG